MTSGHSLRPAAPLAVSPQPGNTCCIPHGWQPDANLLPAVISCLVLFSLSLLLFFFLWWNVISLICHRLLHVCSHLACRNVRTLLCCLCITCLQYQRVLLCSVPYLNQERASSSSGLTERMEVESSEWEAAVCRFFFFKGPIYVFILFFILDTVVGADLALCLQHPVKKNAFQ